MGIVISAGDAWKIDVMSSSGGRVAMQIRRYRNGCHRRAGFLQHWVHDFFMACAFNCAEPAWRQIGGLLCPSVALQRHADGRGN